MVFNEGDRYKLDLYGKEYFVHLKKYAVRKQNKSFWWAEAEEGVFIPGWAKTVSGRSGILLGLYDDEVEKRLKQNELVLVVSNWKGGNRKKRTRRRRQTRRK